VSITGGQKPSVRVQMNPTAIACFGLNLEDVRTALMQTTLIQAKGNFDGPQKAYQINGNDQLLKSED
jgi:multidrug efflux pump